MKTVSYKKHVLKVVPKVDKTDKSCEGCFFFEAYPAWERPCGQSPLDKNFPECLASFRKDHRNVIFVKVD